MIKKTFWTILFFMAVSACSFAQKNEYIVTGKVVDASPDDWIVYLQTIDGDNANSFTTLDSTTTTKGSFTLKGNAGVLPEVRFLKIKNAKTGELKSGLFISEPGEIRITCDTLSTVSGGKQNNALQAFNDSLAPYFKTLQSIQKKAEDLGANGQLSEENSLELQSEYLFLLKKVSNVVNSYITSNIDNKVGEFHFYAYAGLLQTEQIKSLYASASLEFQQNPNVQLTMEQRIWANETNTPSGVFEDIELSTIDGKRDKISNYRGKIVLIDFWASWCGPCMKETPMLVNLYNKFKGKDFEMIGISLDEDQNDWANAVRNKNMSWIHMSDLGGWKGKAARQYKIKSIPQIFLLDKEGNIVAHNLKGAALMSKIEELLAQ